MNSRSWFYAIFIVSCFAFLALGIYRSPFFRLPSGQAEAFGITPPYIKHDSLVPGDSFKRAVTLVRSASNKDIYISVKLKSDGFGDWVDYDEDIVFPAGRTRLPIIFDFKVPENAEAGEYSGSVYFVMKPDKRQGVSVGLGATASIDLKLLSEAESMAGSGGSMLLRTVKLQDNDAYLKYRGMLVIDNSDNYKAYYIHPIWHRAYFFGNDEQAHELVGRVAFPAEPGTLAGIPVATTVYGEDSDGDGLSDILEKAIGTSRQEADSDFDGFSDKDELDMGYDPLGPGSPARNKFDSRDVSGRLFKDNGWIWYISPGDGERYIIGSDTSNIFTIMRQLAIKISSEESDQLFN